MRRRSLDPKKRVLFEITNKTKKYGKISTHQSGEALSSRHGKMVNAVAVGDLLPGGNVSLRDEYHLMDKFAHSLPKGLRY